MEYPLELEIKVRKVTIIILSNYSIFYSYSYSVKAPFYYLLILLVGGQKTFLLFIEKSSNYVHTSWEKFKLSSFLFFFKL